jgi:hypothetical protein
MDQNTRMTRDQAVALKLHKFMPVILCKRKHNSMRYTSTGQCVQCAINAATRFNERKNGPVTEVRVRMMRQDIAAVTALAKYLAATRGVQL